YVQVKGTTGATQPGGGLRACGVAKIGKLVVQKYFACAEYQVGVHQPLAIIGGHLRLQRCAEGFFIKRNCGLAVVDGEMGNGCAVVGCMRHAKSPWSVDGNCNYCGAALVGGGSSQAARGFH